MKYKTLILWMLSVVVLLFPTGCATGSELGNLAIVTGLFLEPTNNGYHLVADCIDFSQQEQKNTFKTMPVIATAPTLSEAFSLLNTQSEAPLYFDRAKVLVFSKSFSEYDKNQIAEELFALKIIRTDISLLETEISAEILCSDKYLSFGLSLDSQLKKEKISSNCKLYQLINKPQNIRNLPTVLLSENGFYLQS